MATELVNAMIGGDDELTIQLLEEEHIKWGNVWGIGNIIRAIVKHGNKVVCTHLFHLYPESWRMQYRVGWMLAEFALRTRVGVFGWMMEECEKRNVLFRLNNYISGHGIRNVIMLDYLADRGWQPTQESVWCGIYYGNVIFCKWCFEHGYTQINPMNFKLRPSVPYTKELLVLLHHYCIPGAYQDNCALGACDVCRIRTINNLWEMDSATVSSYIQWLPNEMLVEIGEVM